MPRTGGHGRIIRIALPILAAVVVLLALAQIFLPRIAASTVSSKVERYGKVRSISVSAWPAVKLLWNSADSVTLHAGSLALSPAQSAELLSESSDTAKLDATVAEVHEGPLRLTDASITKRGNQLHGEALISEAGVDAALPPGVSVRLLGSAHGQVRVRVGGGLFGIGASVEAVAGAEGGNLVVRPQAPLIGSAVRVTLFSDPHIYVEGVGAEVASTNPLSYRLSMDARLR
jgi:hypothetical protein